MDADAFVHRVFTVDGREVACRFFRSEPDRGSFACRYEIDWPEGTRGRSISGVDEVQALLLAMQAAHLDLLLARRDDGRLVSWLDEARLGLPIADVVRDLEVGPDARDFAISTPQIRPP
jgi:hypothetical protein